MQKAIFLECVGKIYGSERTTIVALDDVTLTIPAGQFVSVMGPSGSGKSTLLHMIAGLDTLTRGRIVIAGRDIATLSDNDRSDLRLRHMGIVFQGFNLFPTFTVQENVSWPLEFLGVGRGVAVERSHVILHQVGLSAAAWQRRPTELSGGEQQRVAIARALVTEPDLLLADEPTGNLDSCTSQSILDLLRHLNCEKGVTIILVTHSTFAATYGDRTVEIRDGRVVRDVTVPRTSHLELAPGS
jgi:putative ABC transport system ATP-binding protein